MEREESGRRYDVPGVNSQEEKYMHFLAGAGGGDDRAENRRVNGGGGGGYMLVFFKSCIYISGEG